jgi:hypothetical protein
MDCTRRRRWIRTRAQSRAEPLNEATRPLTLYWDVKTRRNGTKIVRLRSGLLIRNTMPFPIDIVLGDFPSTSSAGGSASTDSGRFEYLGPIAEGETLGVPLLLANAASLRFRPSNAEERYGWTDFFGCKQKANDPSRVQSFSTDLACAPNPDVIEAPSDAEDADVTEALDVIYMRVSIDQVGSHTLSGADFFSDRSAPTILNTST